MAPTKPLKARSSKGRIVAIEKDMALIDIGLKTEGRVALTRIHQSRPRAGAGRRRRS